MRSAKQVTIEEPLSPQDAQDLLQHGQKSAFWYCDNMNATEGMVRNKLLAKGYPDREVRLSDGGSINFVSTIIEWCRENDNLEDDSETAQYYADKCIREGKGPSDYRAKLQSKGLDDETIESWISSYDEEAAIPDAVRKTLLANSVQKVTGHDREQRIIHKLRARGFSIWSVKEYLERNPDILE